MFYMQVRFIDFVYEFPYQYKYMYIQIKCLVPKSIYSARIRSQSGKTLMSTNCIVAKICFMMRDVTLSVHPHRRFAGKLFDCCENGEVVVWIPIVVK